MSTAAPAPKSRLIRLQQELVSILRATGSIDGAERYWKRIDFNKGFGRKLACYGFHRLERQLMINRVAFPEINFVEVDAALHAGNRLRQIYALAHGEAWIARDLNQQYKIARKGLKIISRKRARAKPD
jgi:hypothetical protein